MLSRGAYGRGLLGLTAGLVLWLAGWAFASGAISPVAAMISPVGVMALAVGVCVLVAARVGRLGRPAWLGLLFAPLLLATVAAVQLLCGGAIPGFKLGLQPLNVPFQVIACLATLMFLARHPDDRSLGGSGLAKGLAVTAVLILSVEALNGLISGSTGVQPVGRFFVIFTVLTPLASLVLLFAYPIILRGYRCEGTAEVEDGLATPSFRSAHPTPYAGGDRATFGRRGL